jgi:autotransporter-associated beta strand protein
MNEKLTAYALNELPPDERAELEAQLQHDPALAAQAEEIKAFCHLLGEHIAPEDEAFTSEQRLAIIKTFKATPAPQTAARPWRKVLMMSSTVLAACLAVMMITHYDTWVSPPSEYEQASPTTVRARRAEDVAVNPPAAAATAAEPRKDAEAAKKQAATAPRLEVVSTPPSVNGLKQMSPTDALASDDQPQPFAKKMPAAPITTKSEAALAQSNKPAPQATAPSKEVASRSTSPASREAAKPLIMSTAIPDQPLEKAAETTADKLMPTDKDILAHKSDKALPTAPALSANPMPAPAYDTTNGSTIATDTKGDLGLTKSGAGTWNFSAANTYAGGTVINGGTLTINGGGSTLDMNGSSTTFGNLTGGTAAPTGTNGQAQPMPPSPAPASPLLAANGDGKLGTITLGESSTTLQRSAGSDLTFSGGVAMTKAGNGTLALGTVSSTLQPAPAMPIDKAKTASSFSVSGAGDVKLVNGATLGDTRTEFETIAGTVVRSAPTDSPAMAGANNIRPDSIDGLIITGGTGAVVKSGNGATMSIGNGTSFTNGNTTTLGGLGGIALNGGSPTVVGQIVSGTSLPAGTTTTAVTGDVTSMNSLVLNGTPQGDVYMREKTQIAVGSAGFAGKGPQGVGALTLTGVDGTKIVPNDGQELKTFGSGRVEILQEKTALPTTVTPPPPVPGSQTYRPIIENPFTYVAQEPLSTFSTDVDTASYANIRHFLNTNQRPPADAVRLEELINYFPYSYEPPADDKPFAVHVDVVEAPWQPLHRLARIGLKAREIHDERRAGNFVFLLDVSGSMSPPERLPLIKQGLRMLVEQLREDDRVSIVTYAGESGVALESTSGAEKEKITQAIERLKAGGSTNGASGIALAYEQAKLNFKKDGINRVILATDGDFNVGVSNVQQLEALIAEKAKTGVFLSVLGVGTDNLHDHTMQTLADRGNGNYHYLDSLSEARKVLVDQMAGTLVTVAKDVKIQVEFNPAQVAAYRLIGYEKRMMAKQDFNNDKKDAGEIGAGHTITALYEIVPASLKYPDGKALVDDLKYAPKPAEPAAETAPSSNKNPASSNELMTVRLRYKAPDGDKSQLMEQPVTDPGKKLSDAPKDFKFAVSVAGFGMLLRDSQQRGDLSWDLVRNLAQQGKGEDPNGYRGEFLQLIDKARSVCEPK